MENNFAQIWSQALDILKNEMSLVGYKTYVEVISPRVVDSNTICFILPSSYHIDICKKRFLDLIENTLTMLTNKSYKIVFESKEIIPDPLMEKQEETNNNEISQETTKEENNFHDVSINENIKRTNETAGLKEKYTFENFIIGSNNRFAHAAAIAVSENPGKKYNPYLYMGELDLEKHI